ncbi:MAG: hypothetical protein ABI281_04495 [Caldimonas sp.]
MQTNFDQTVPSPSRWDQDGAEYVRSSIDWCARCSKRLVAMNPALTAEQALDLALDMSHDDSLRACMPERVAEDLHKIDLSTDD